MNTLETCIHPNIICSIICQPHINNSLRLLLTRSSKRCRVFFSTQRSRKERERSAKLYPNLTLVVVLKGEPWTWNWMGINFFFHSWWASSVKNPRRLECFEYISNSVWSSKGQIFGGFQFCVPLSRLIIVVVVAINKPSTWSYSIDFEGACCCCPMSNSINSPQSQSPPPQFLLSCNTFDMSLDWKLKLLLSFHSRSSPQER